jgi:cobyrinic acid a,c-diamide synthase
VVERPDEIRSALDRLADAVAGHVDLDLVVRLAAAAPGRPVDDPPSPPVRGRCRIAVAGGPAFSFGYPDNLELLAAAGAEIVPFDPLRDPALPEAVDGLVAGGGFPEVFADALADNRPLLADTRDRVGRGLVVWAECGGLLWLSRRLDDRPLCGVVPAEGRMTTQLTLGYRTARFRRSTPLGTAGTVLRGHEFHYSTLDPAGDGLDLEGSTGATRSGWASPRLLASYLHLHLAGAPQVVSNLVRTIETPGRPVTN